jgi:hypothetical protein
MSILIGWWKRYKIYYGSLLQTSWFLLEAQDRDTRRETEDGGDMRDALERTDLHGRHCGHRLTQQPGA